MAPTSTRRRTGLSISVGFTLLSYWEWGEGLCRGCIECANIDYAEAPSRRGKARPERIVLFHFGTIDGGGLLTVVLADDHALIGVECAATARVEGDGCGVHYISARIAGQGEFVALLFAAGKIVTDEVGRGGAGGATGGRAELGQSGGVAAELGIILHLDGMNRLDGCDSSRFLRVHAGAAQARGGDHDNDQDDRDYDQQLDE